MISETIVHKMECGQCGENFCPGDLAEVFKHEHSGISCDPKIGLCMQRVFSENESTNIERLKFDYEEGTVDTLYRNGKEYRWLDIPSKTLVDFSNCGGNTSPGAFLSRHIKGNYRYYCMNGD